MKTKLHLRDLPKDKIYLSLRNEFKEPLFKAFLSYFASYRKAGKFLGIKSDCISKWEKKNYTPIWAIFKISKFLNKKGYKLSVKDVEKNIVAYRYKNGKPILNPKFPINFDSIEGAIVAAALLCDGGINKKGYPIYNNSEECMRGRVVYAINKLIGNTWINPSKPYENNCLSFPKILKDILVIGLDMQIGDKVLTNPVIPEIFLNTKKKEVIGELLNQAFSDDGTAYISKIHNQGCIAFGVSTDASKHSETLRKKMKKEKLTNYAPNLVKGCKILLEKLGIKVNGPYLKREYIRRKDGEEKIIQVWSIQIQGKKNIEKYKYLVGFSIERKNKRVEEILNNYKEVDYGLSFEDALQKVIELEKEGREITPRTFMEKRNCTLEYARELLCWLKKEGALERSGGGQNKGTWGMKPYEYKIVKSNI